MASSFDWKRFEAVVTEAALAAARKLMDKHAASFYAVAFHMFYAETGSRMDLPLLAANTLESLAEDDTTRWSSPDWRWDNIPYMHPELKKLHRTLIREMAGKNDAHWNVAYARFIQAFVNVAKAMRAKLKTHEHASKDFCVLVCTEDSAEVEVLRRCLSTAQFKRLFPELETEQKREKQLRESPLAEKLQAYRQDLYKYENEVLDLGEKAIPMLLDALKRPNKGWLAARLLGHLGIPDPKVIAALRKRAAEGSNHRWHDATALACLGDLDFLFALANKNRTREIATRAICFLYWSGVNECRCPHPLDYALLERLMAKPPCRRYVNDCLKPGIPPLKIDASDVDEALRGLESKYAVIRQHTVLILGDPKLGKAAAERILPAVAARLKDNIATVRRLAVLSLHYWGKAAKPFAPEVRKLFEDSNRSVADTARRYIPK